MIFGVVVLPPPPPDIHYFCFTNPFRCKELIYHKLAPYRLFCWKVLVKLTPQSFQVQKSPARVGLKIQGSNCCFTLSVHCLFIGERLSPDVTLPCHPKLASSDIKNVAFITNIKKRSSIEFVEIDIQVLMWHSKLRSSSKLIEKSERGNFFY